MSPFSITYHQFHKVDDMDFDCGRSVEIYEAKTPIGTYQYYREPVHEPECDGPIKPGERDHAGEICVFGPFYEPGDEHRHIAWTGNAITARQLIHADIVSRVKACFKVEAA